MNLPVIVSLGLYERILLKSFRDTFFPDGLHLVYNPKRYLESTVRMFHWPAKILYDSQIITHSDDWYSTHRGNGQMIWEALLRRLQVESFGYDSCHSRLSRFLEDNPSLEERFVSAENDDIPNLQVVPAPMDEEYWDILVNLKFIFKSGMPNIADIEVARSVLSLSKAIVSLSSAVSDGPLSALATTPRLENADLPDTISDEPRDNIRRETVSDIRENIQQAAVNQETPNLVTNLPEEEAAEAILPKSEREFEIWSLVRSCSILCRSNNDNLELVRDCLRKSGFFDSHEAYGDAYYVHKKYSKRGEDKYIWSVSDPVKYLEYIPWEDLRIPDGSSPERKMLWSPERAVRHDHHLHTEEEVFKFCLENEFYFPNYLESNSIVFIPSMFKGSKLLDEMDMFWEKWNDCAISLNPDDQQWYLLETIPGLQFRRFCDKQSQVAGLNFFRRIVDDYRYGRVSMLEEILGFENTWSKYEGLLEVIPFSEISNVDPNPLGGSNGIVYHAEWLCPQKINMAAPQSRPVALKTMRARGDKESKDFLKELDASFAALQGNPIRCIEFYGIMKTPLENGSEENLAPFLPPGVLFLVFEWALKGSLLDHLTKHLKGEPSDWEIILGFMEDLAAGIQDLHDQNIIHRDIHRNNVLLTTHPTPNDPYTRESLELVISDFGEGRASDSDRSMGRKYYGNVEFWAPEVRRFHTYSFASDIYAIGRVMADMIGERWKAVLAKTGCVDRTVPQCLLDIINWCVAPQPQDRPQAKELREKMEDISQDVLDDNFQVVFTDFVQAPERQLIQVQTMRLDYDSEEFDEDGIPF